MTNLGALPANAAIPDDGMAVPNFVRGEPGQFPSTGPAWKLAIFNATPGSHPGGGASSPVNLGYGMTLPGTSWLVIFTASALSNAQALGAWSIVGGSAISTGFQIVAVSSIAQSIGGYGVVFYQ